MALVKKQRDSSMRHPQSRIIKGDPRMEKRQQPRFTSHFRSTISGGQREGQGRTLDLSTGGCKIETDLPVVVGDVPGLIWPALVMSPKTLPAPCSAPPPMFMPPS